MDNTDKQEIWLSRAIDIGAAVFVGTFFAVAAWFWAHSGDGVVLAAVMSGLPVCF